jgi:hypothetical protein
MILDTIVRGLTAPFNTAHTIVRWGQFYMSVIDVISVTIVWPCVTRLNQQINDLTDAARTAIMTRDKMTDSLRVHHGVCRACREPYRLKNGDVRQVITNIRYLI